MAAKLAGMLVVALEFFGADNTLDFIGIYYTCRSLQTEYGFSELKADFLLIS